MTPVTNIEHKYLYCVNLKTGRFDNIGSAVIISDVVQHCIHADDDS